MSDYIVLVRIQLWNNGAGRLVAFQPFRASHRTNPPFSSPLVRWAMFNSYRVTHPEQWPLESAIYDYLKAEYSPTDFPALPWLTSRQSLSNFLLVSNRLISVDGGEFLEAVIALTSEELGMTDENPGA